MGIEYPRKSLDAQYGVCVVDWYRFMHVRFGAWGGDVSFTAQYALNVLGDMDKYLVP
jgi:hypothetical protein